MARVKKPRYDVLYYYKGKNPIAGSTVAVSDTLAYFKTMAKSWEELKELLPYGYDEKEIIDKYIELGADYDEIIFK